MKHLAAYCLLVLGGNAQPSKEDVANLLKASGVNTDEEQLSIMMTKLEGKSITELISEGRKELATMGGNAGAAGAPTAEGKDAAGGAPAVQEEEKPKVEEEDEVEGMDALFPDDDDY